MPRPTSQDLAGFWDLLQLSIDDVTVKFDQLQQIKNNNWRPIDSPEKKVRDRLGTVSPEPRQPLDVTAFLIAFLVACILYKGSDKTSKTGADPMAPCGSINRTDRCNKWSEL